MTKRSAKRKATNATTEIVDLSSYERAVAKSEAAMMAMEERIEQEVIKEKLVESDPHAFRASFVLECEREDAVVIETSRALMKRTFEQNLNTHAAPLCVTRIQLLSTLWYSARASINFSWQNSFSEEG